jgi:hypothetical protein
MSITQVNIGTNGNKVVFSLDGKTVEIPWEHANEIARALFMKARQAEEEEKALGIIRDNAILLRAGVPIGLSDRKDIKNETIQTAKYDRDLRRYMPGGIKSRELFGAPTIIRSNP